MKHSRLIIVALVLIGIIVLRVLGVNHILQLESVQQHKAQLMAFVINHYWLAVLSYIATYIVVAACALPGAAVLTLVGGFLFGGLWGTCYTVTAATVGATIAFIATRTLFTDFLYRRYGHMLEQFKSYTQEYGPFYILLMRLVPLFPFFLVTLVAAFTSISTGAFILSTFVGIIPGTLAYTLAGKQLAHVHSLKDILSPEFIISLVIICALAFAGLILKQKHNKKV